MIRAAIIDDEALARDRIRDLLSDSAEFEVVAEAAGGREALAAIRNAHPSLIFLDVQMPELDGFGVLEALQADERPPGVIFVTAYDRYAISAFDVNAVDYLLKPYTAERFESALERARERLERNEGSERIESLLRSVAKRATIVERLPVRSKEGVQFVPVVDIDWLSADGNYVQIHSGTATLRVRETISELEERLQPSGFLRVHRSALINTDRILRIEPWAHGEYLIVLRNGAKVNTGRGYGIKVRELFA
jgi:two-component system, LytTR family, response regulator